MSDNKKTYVLKATELNAVNITVTSEKSPEEFQSIEEFYNQADVVFSKVTHDGEYQFTGEYDSEE